jgi:hypothetical protein
VGRFLGGLGEYSVIFTELDENRARVRRLCPHVW